MKALEELVQEGKIGGIALSEVGEATLRKAAKVTKIVGVEVELSLFSLDPLNNGVAKACAELGIPIIACKFDRVSFISRTYMYLNIQVLFKILLYLLYSLKLRI